MPSSATSVDPPVIDLALTNEALSHWTCRNPASRTLDGLEHRPDSLDVEDAAEILSLEVTPHASRSKASGGPSTLLILDKLKEAVSSNEDWARLFPGTQDAEDENAMRKAAAQRALLVRSLQVLRTIFGDTVPDDREAYLEFREDRVTTHFEPHSKDRNTWSMMMTTDNGGQHHGQVFVAHPIEEALEPVRSWGDPNKGQNLEIGFGSGTSTRPTLISKSDNFGSAIPSLLKGHIPKSRKWHKIKTKALKVAPQPSNTR